MDIVSIAKVFFVVWSLCLSAVLLYIASISHKLKESIINLNAQLSPTKKNSNPRERVQKLAQQILSNPQTIGQIVFWVLKLLCRK